MGGVESASRHSGAAGPGIARSGSRRKHGVCVYCSANKWSELVCRAFAQGIGAPLVPPAPLRAGDVFMYGALRGLLATLRQAQREHRDWYYADNGYFRSGKDEGSYFRVTRNALQHDGTGTPDEEAIQRWRKLKIPIAPWRTSGSHVVICPPARLFGATFGFSADDWLERTLLTLGKHTDRELRVRAKISWNDAKPAAIITRKGKPKASITEPLADDLAGAWALVTHSSNAAVEALLAGIPAFCTDICGASALALQDLNRIESPWIPEGRECWAAVLASHQWTLAELRSGKCWADLQAFKAAG